MTAPLPLLPFPILTPRLLLRPLSVTDAPSIFAAKRESWDELSRWGIWIFKPLSDMTIADDEEFCRRKIALFESRQDITVCLEDRHSGEFIGGAGLHKCDWEQRTFSLGFWIRTNEVNKGYATEAGTALAYFAFEALGASRLESLHAEGNKNSQRVLDKIGFRPQEISKAAHTLPDGRSVDEYRYTLSDPGMLPPLAVCWDV